jgi:hypothetical protein
MISFPGKQRWKMPLYREVSVLSRGSYAKAVVPE